MKHKKRRYGMSKRELVDYLENRDGTTCYICTKSLIPELLLLKRYYVTLKGKRTKINVNVDHIEPFCRSKDNSLENLRLVHKNCNEKKGDSELSTRKTCNIVNDCATIKM